VNFQVGAQCVAHGSCIVMHSWAPCRAEALEHHTSLCCTIPPCHEAFAALSACWGKSIVNKAKQEKKQTNRGREVVISGAELSSCDVFSWRCVLEGLPRGASCAVLQELPWGCAFQGKAASSHRGAEMLSELPFAMGISYPGCGNLGGFVHFLPLRFCWLPTEMGFSSFHSTVSPPQTDLSTVCFSVSSLPFFPGFPHLPSASHTLTSTNFPPSQHFGAKHPLKRENSSYLCSVSGPNFSPHQISFN